MPQNKISILASKDLVFRFFPASIVVDALGNILDFGPSLAKCISGIVCGANLSDYFRFDSDTLGMSIPDLAMSEVSVELFSDRNAIKIRGIVLNIGACYLIMGRHLPVAFSIGLGNLEMNDFGPDDPIVSALLLVGVQKAMLEEAQETTMELALARQYSQEILQRFSRVAGYMAHDFNNLLSIVRLNTERMLSDQGISDRNRRLSQIIRETTDRGSEITRSLMTLASQRHDSSLPLAIDQLITENFAFFNSIAGSEVTLAISLHSANAIVESSRSGFLNCIINLIINARDAMPDGGSITISTRIRRAALPIRSAGAGANGQPLEYVAIEVRDTGVGMSAEVASRAFEPLFSTKSHGSGIGLASVLDFAREMGGDACLESRLDEGTSVFLYMPIRKQGSEDKQFLHSATLQTGLKNESSRLKGISVLLVEDEPYALEALTEMLAEWGMNVRACACSSEAILALDDQGGKEFQLLLSDIVMSDGSGIDLAHEAISRQPSIQIILMSGFVPQSEKLAANWQFIRKPLDSEELFRMIEAAVDGF